LKPRLLALAAAVAVVVGACSVAGSGSGSPPDGSAGKTVVASVNSAPVVVTDALGRTVAFAAVPSRIAIAGKASFLVNDAVYMFPEASSRVVALTKATQGSTDFISAIDPGYATKTILDGNAGAEQIAAVNPDVVIAKTSSKQSLGDPLEAIGIKVVYVDFETAEQYTRDLATLGALFGDPARARRLSDYFSSQIDRIKTAVGGLARPKPDVLLLYYSSKNGATAFQVPPLGYIQTTEAEAAGGNPVWKEAQLGSGWTTVSLEQIAVWNPDQVYVIAYFDNPADVVARLLGDTEWQGLTAARSKSVYAFPGDFYSWDEPDPRWALGMTWLATRVNPELVGSFDMTTETRDFYSTLYGMDEATFDATVAPRLPAEFR